MSGDYQEVHVVINPLEPAREILIAKLSQLPFESVLETPNGFKAYMAAEVWQEAYLSVFKEFDSSDTRITVTQKTIPATNWNLTWESDYDPIVVDDRCRIRAPFHPRSKEKFDIEIMPKMSFGTGHHETTYLMVQMMLDMNIEGRKVLDMGCGTGVLAILACKMGASDVLAIDIDPWSYENSLENVSRNNCSGIRVMQGDASHLPRERKFDIILANINLNILLTDMEAYVQCLYKGGTLLLSGFYREDLNEITSAGIKQGITIENFMEKNNWVSAKYVF